MARLAEYFAGGYDARIPAEDYDEFLAIPKCTEAALDQAVRKAVEDGVVWLVNGPASVWRMPVPEGALGDGAELRPPPKPVAAQELTEETLPGAWKDGKTNGAALTQALSMERGYTVPWPLMAQALKDSVNSQWLSLASNSASLGSTWDQAGSVVLERPSVSAGRRGKAAVGESGGLFPAGAVPAGAVVLDGPQVQDLAEKVPELMAAGPTAELRFHVRVEATGDLPDGERRDLDALLSEVKKGMEVG